MNSCPSIVRTVLSVACLCGLIAAAPPLAAQSMVREFPRAALRGTLEIVAPPVVLLDGQPDRLSPGARLRSPTNHLLMTGALVGERMLVNFTREPSGLIHEVWVLSPAEAALSRESATPVRNFKFESEANTAPKDDGKTPFHLLPKFPQR